MSKPPAFQFYADDYLGGTQKFTDAECGLYIRLLCAQWNEGGLPNDDSELQSYGKCKTPVNRIREKFKLCKDGKLRNERLEEVREEQRLFRESKAKSGRNGAEKRWHSHSTAIAQPCVRHAFAIGETMAKGMANDSSPSPTPSPIIERERETNLPEIPPISRKDYDALCQMRGIPDDCRDWFWNTHDARNWVDSKGHPIHKVEPLLMNALKAWRLKQPTNGKTQSGVDKMIQAKELDDVKESIRRIRAGYEPHQTMSEQDRAKLKPLVKRRDELKQLLGIVV